MFQQKTILQSFVQSRGNSLLAQIIAVMSGVALLSCLAQVAIPLPWTPVPITGQTFGVALIGLHWGRRLGLLTVISYLALGSFGLPIFAAASSGLILGPTLGYLIGMVFAVGIIGTLADLGWNQKWWTAYLACLCGSFVIFSCGLFVLSYFVSQESLLSAGLYPFVAGDQIKSLTAAGLTAAISQGTKPRIK